MTASRRILVVTPQLPDPPHWGFAIRVRELVRDLSLRHSVTLLSYALPWQHENVRNLRAICDSVHTVPAPWPEGPDQTGRLRSLVSRTPYAVRRLTSPTMQNTLDELLANGAFDLVQVESSLMSGLDLRHAPVTILDEHNIEYELLERTVHIERTLSRKAFNLIEFLKVRQTEQRAWKSYDGLVVTSERELSEVTSSVPRKPVAIVPNGVDLVRFAPSPVASTSGLVYAGLMGYRPNIDAVTHFVREILPLIHRTRPEVTFTIVGWGTTREVHELAGPRVIVTEGVPDVRPYLSNAEVVVTPIRIGGGTRLKILEALAMARPLVSTSLACEGLDVTAETHLLVADDPSQFASAVLRLLEDRPLANRLGLAGRRLMESRYGWNGSAAQLEALYEQVLASKRHRSSYPLLPLAASTGSEAR